MYWEDYLLNALIGLVGLIILGCVLAGLDILFGEKKISEVQIVGKDHKAPFTTTVLLPVGKVMVPQVHHYPESWILIGRTMQGKSVRISVGHDRWHEEKIGEYTTYISYVGLSGIEY